MVLTKLTPQHTIMTNNEFQLMGPRINNAGPFSLQYYVASVLYLKAIWFTAMQLSIFDAVDGQRFIDILHQRHVAGMIKVHNGFTNDILRQIA